jgi:hypothetical protein
MLKGWPCTLLDWITLRSSDNSLREYAAYEYPRKSGLLISELGPSQLRRDIGPNLETSGIDVRCVLERVAECARKNWCGHVTLQVPKS